MLVVKAKTKGGTHDDVSVCRRVDDFGISVFHRPGRSYRPKASSLNRVRDDTIRSGEQAVEQSLINRCWRNTQLPPGFTQLLRV
jgi:hypothetical protein